MQLLSCKNKTLEFYFKKTHKLFVEKNGKGGEIPL